jgi:hypothetical protein
MKILLTILCSTALLFCAGCGGQGMVWVPANSPSLTETDALHAAEVLMEFCDGETNVWQPLPSPRALPGNCCLEIDSRDTNRGTITLVKPHSKPAHIKVSLENGRVKAE